MIRSQCLRRAALFGASCLLLQPALARATFLLDSFIVPPPSINADRFTWDVMYSPSVDPGGNGANYPDFRGFGTKQTASAAGFAVPTNSRPTNPSAYFDVRNPTITQTGDKNAFIVDPGSTGNIYSPFAATSYRVDGSTTRFASPYNIGTISFQYQTAGTLIDYNNIRLQYTDGSGAQRSLAATETLREHSGSTGSSFGGLTNRTALQWDLSGLGVRTYQITFGSVTSSNSFQIATLATAATYADIVPASREWSAGAGNWSGGFRDRQGNAGLSANTNGNVRFTNTAAAATVLDANYTVGEVRFTTPAAASINSPGGSTLTMNTGVTTTAAATGAYTIGANVAFGAFNIFEINGGQVALNGAVTGTEGFEKDGAGTLTIGGNFTAAGGVSVAAGTLRVNGTLGGGGSLDLAGGAVLAGAGTVGRAFSVVAGSVISPGNSVGMLNTAAQTWEGGGIYRFELNTATNDLVQITGGLTLTAAAAAAPFKLELRTLTLAGTAGALESFDPNTAHTWRIATASGGVMGFNANGFQVDTTGFANAFNGTFAVELNGNSVYLTYAPVQEPGTVCWLVGAGCIAAVACRRRKRPATL